ncbi:uncharacterized protein LOC127363592 isoform X4 [Dicentrarchus labrax]|uniref:uncharacterized protein LOC127363592 isoform X4 n=1 Tax=Dicentrarchus labrax TaxID=13489 RepID=UPI0021F5354B|nr:uncharacterized protein LOC127363592 isoform X4 [Dicentrarchus labrax]
MYNTDSIYKVHGMQFIWTYWNSAVCWSTRGAIAFSPAYKYKYIKDKLNSARRTDSGDYQLQTYGSDGKLLDTIKMHLEIKAPVSKPDVSQMCLSPEQMNISCSSEGEEIEFILTLDGHLLIQTRDHSHSQSSSKLDTLPLAGSTDNQHKPSVSIVTISLHGQLTGNLMCNVRNNISKEQTVIHLTSCKGSISHFSLGTVAVIASFATLLVHLALFLGIKHFNKTRPMTVNEDNAADEIIYSDVRVMNHARKTGPNSHQNAT